MTILFFDIGATIADVKVTADGLIVFHPRARVFEVLDGLAGVRKGIISYPGEGDAARARAAAALAASFSSYFTETELVHWGSKNDRTIFDSAAASGAAAANDCVFVGEDANERRAARDAGLRAAPHPIFALAAIENRPVFWVRIDVPPNSSLAELEAVANANEVVPVHVPTERSALAMATARGVTALEQASFMVDLRAAVDETSAYLLRDDRALITPPSFAGAAPQDEAKIKARMRAAAAFAFISQELAGFTRTVIPLGPGPGGVYIAAEAGTHVEELHIPGAKHGHTERLMADPALLSRPGESQAAGFVSGFASGGPSDKVVDAVRQSITSAGIRTHIARLSGVTPLVDDMPLKVRSRDVGSEYNMLVVDALARRFQELELAVKLHEFSFRGKRLANVEAEYSVAGSDAAVLITAHLDSTAAGGEYVGPNGLPRRYDPAIDPAPGADDDASGMAAVLAAAECVRSLADAGCTPTRTLRFVLFNAEEQGLVGSKAYARAAAGAGDRIAAVLQMDMIGGYQGGTRKVEIHAGSTVEGAVVGASNALGDVVARAVRAVAPSFDVERITGPTDPAAGRSDHASFHERGWAAVAVSENFFADTEPASGTRQYHLPGDTLNDRDHNTTYAAEIARAVAAAALTLAGV